jgi:hypothetical protein
MSRKNEIPGWLPFAIVASGLVVLAAGARSGWKLASDRPKPPPPATPPIAQGGVLQDWISGDYRI